MPAVVIRDLHKRYGDVVALDRLSLSVGEGELFGVIGPDGAGKTSLFRILVTLLKPDGGSAAVDGLDVVRDYRKLRPRLGYMPGRFSLYQDLSVIENLTFFASVFGTTVEEGYDLVRDIYVQIEPFKDRRAGALSGGMKQKLALSCALIHRPTVLFLDEPTTGVDAVSRVEFWDMLAQLRDGGLTIVVSTPYMDEARRCDRVAMLHQGRLLGLDTPAALEAAFPRPLLAVRVDDRYGALQLLRAYPHAHSVHSFGDTLHYAEARPEADPDALRAHLHANGFPDAEVAPVAAEIEDVFMERMANPSAA